MKPTTVLITEMALGGRALKLPTPIRVNHPEEALFILVAKKDGEVRQKVVVDLESAIKSAKQ